MRMRRGLRMVAFAAVVLPLFLTSTNAANWFVRPNSAGSNTGADWNNAWSTATIKWSNVHAGDTVWLAGGAYANGFTVEQAAGAEGNHIVIKRATTADPPCTGAAGWSPAFDTRVIIYGTVFFHGCKYVTFDGNKNAADEYGIFLDRSTHIAPWTGGIAMITTGIWTSGSQLPSTNLWLQRIELQGRCETSAGGQNSGGCVYICSGSANQPMHGTLLDHLFVHDDSTLLYVNNLINSVVQYSTLSNAVTYNAADHCDAIFFWPCHGSNVLRYIDSPNASSEAWLWEKTGDVGGDYWIYGCTFWKTKDYFSPVGQSPFWGIITKTGASYGNFHVYNNVFIDHQGALQLNGTGLGTEVYNNVFINSVNGRKSGISDYNAYSGSYGGYTYPLADEPHSFVAAADALVDRVSGNLRPVSAIGSGYLRNKGLALRPDGYINRDPAGNIRGADGAWDIGVYEYAGLSTNPVIQVSPNLLNFGTVSAPANLSVTVENIGGGTLGGSVEVILPDSGVVDTNSAFSIVSGRTYTLGANQKQLVPIRFTPTTVGKLETNLIRFSGGGGGALVGVSGRWVNPPKVSSITQSAADVDLSTPGLQVFAGSTVQYSGSASSPLGSALSWQWIYSVNGGPEIILQSGNGNVTGVSYAYTANSGGDTYVWKLRVSDGVSTSESSLTVGVEVPPPPAGTLTFQAGAGTVTAPFFVDSGSILQTVDTDVATGGKAIYQFTLTNSGDYVLRAVVDAPDTAANSFYVNIDGQPQDPQMIWDVSTTSGFEQRIVSWRGNGTFDANQFVPKVFGLTTGVHQLVIVGREPNTQLQSISIVRMLSAPQNLRVVTNP